MTAKRRELSKGAKVFYTIYALFLTLVITVTVTALALSLTVFNSGYIIRISEKYGIPDATRRVVTEQIKTELQNAGVTDEFLLSLVPENLEKQLQTNLKVVYGEAEANNEYSEYRKNVEEKFWQELERQNGSPVSRTDKEAKSIVDQLTDTVLKIYENNTTLPFDAEQVAAPYIRQFKNIVRLCSVVLVVMTVIMIATMKMKYVAVAFGGAAMLFGGLFAGLEISGIIKNIVMQTESDMLLIKAVNGELGTVLLVSAIVCALVWLVCTIISYSSAKSKEAGAKKQAETQQ